MYLRAVIGQVPTIALLRRACLGDDMKSKNGNIAFMVPQNLELHGGRDQITIMQVPSATEVIRFMSKDLAEPVLTVVNRIRQLVNHSVQDNE
ncbi:hypothetical protein BOTNAR_0329g00140 [Botryotinia narcissicola]|uniref:Uncharacterized protein n=1 Tax=Botryotinia narcissicola TaxID=278944 RepID=A0A4Z1HTR1_9HELO|nr:hypothetical protein BOTNAR_0329g00140 [Botryotinia narcissicola]